MFYLKDHRSESYPLNVSTELSGEGPPNLSKISKVSKTVMSALNLETNGSYNVVKDKGYNSEVATNISHGNVFKSTEEADDQIDVAIKEKRILSENSSFVVTTASNQNVAKDGPLHSLDDEKEDDNHGAGMQRAKSVVKKTHTHTKKKFNIRRLFWAK